MTIMSATISPLDLITLGVILGAIALCAIRGFAKSIIGAVKLVGAFIIAKIFGPVLGNVFAEKVFGPKVYGFLEEKIADMIGGISDSMNFSELFSDESNGFVALLNRFGAGDKVAELEAQYGEQLNASKESLSEMVKSFATPFVERFSLALACVLIFIAAFIGLWFVAKLLIAIVDAFPALGKVNHILGAVLGLVIGLALVGGACYLYNVLGGILALMDVGDSFAEKIEASLLFRKIYEFVLSIANK